MKALSSLGKGFGLSDAKASGYDTDGIRGQRKVFVG